MGELAILRDMVAFQILFGVVLGCFYVFLVHLSGSCWYVRHREVWSDIPEHVVEWFNGIDFADVRRELHRIVHYTVVIGTTLAHYADDWVDYPQCPNMQRAYVCQWVDPPRAISE